MQNQNLALRIQVESFPLTLESTRAAAERELHAMRDSLAVSARELHAVREQLAQSARNAQDLAVRDESQQQVLVQENSNELRMLREALADSERQREMLVARESELRQQLVEVPRIHTTPPPSPPTAEREPHTPTRQDENGASEEGRGNRHRRNPSKEVRPSELNRSRELRREGSGTLEVRRAGGEGSEPLNRSRELRREGSSTIRGNGNGDATRDQLERELQAVRAELAQVREELALARAIRAIPIPPPPPSPRSYNRGSPRGSPRSKARSAPNVEGPGISLSGSANVPEKAAESAPLIRSMSVPAEEEEVGHPIVEEKGCCCCTIC